MKIQRRDASPERRILIGLITDKTVLTKIAQVYKPEIFLSKWAGLVAEWAVGYFNRYGEPPKENIEREFHKWASRTKDDSTVSLVEKFLEGLSGEYESLSTESNTQYVLDTAGEYFRKVKLQRLSEGVAAALEDEDVANAQSLVDGFHPVEMGVDVGIDVLGDLDASKAAFESRAEPLITYSGALGNFFGSALERDGFIGILAPSKRAKSYTMLDIAWRGMMNRKKIAYFQVGDLTKNQVIRRFDVRAARRPFYATMGNKAEVLNHPIRIPIGIEKLSKDKVATVDFKEVDFNNPITFADIAAAKKRVREKLRSSTPLLKLSVHDTNTVSVKGIDAVLDTWETHFDWIADIIIIDYADLLTPIDSRQEKRHQINETWMALRSLSQKRHCLVVTATQSDAKGAEVYTLTRGNFSENQLKVAHVTGMFGLNQTNEEKEQQIWRLNWLVLREQEFVETHCVHVAGCLAIANPFMKSTF
jgi:hypothetical protein